MSETLEFEVEPVEWNADRVHVVSYPYALPSKCVICGNVPNNAATEIPVYFVDFQFDIDYYGRVYFCSNCFIAACLNLGYHAPSAFRKVESERDGAVAENLRLENENGKLRAALSVLSSLNPVLDSSDSLSGDGQDLAEDGSADIETESRIDSSSDEQRSSDLSDVTGGDLLRNLGLEL